MIQLYYSEGSRDVADDYLHIWPLLPSYLWELDYSRASECPFSFPVFLVYVPSAFLLIFSGIVRSQHLHCHYTVVPALVAVTHSHHPPAKKLSRPHWIFAGPVNCHLDASLVSDDTPPPDQE